VQVSTPSPSENANTERQISEIISKINGMFGSLEFLPVHHYHHNLDEEEYYALLCVADVALLTPLRDGMNTTSHEFVACQKENQGVLILRLLIFNVANSQEHQVQW
jgi:trehalose 6-phosphate synthase/phosphatase